MFTIEKLTVGYVREFNLTRQLRFGAGVSASLHLTPRELDSIYGKNPSSWLGFVRVKL